MGRCDHAIEKPFTGLEAPPAKIQESIKALEQGHQPAAKADAKGEDDKEHPADPHSALGKNGKAAKASN